jgi:parallel beta-helix repeat protein
MNVPGIILNARKRFVSAAAMAAVFVILASGSNALANTIWCVTKTAVMPNPACTPATTFSTISAVFALTSAPGPVMPFDVIVVGAGYYNESVNISVFNVTIVGAQAGRDARVGRYDPSKESIVDATNQENTTFPNGGGAAFTVGGHNVVIDGFTIKGGGVTSGTPGPFASGIFVANGVTHIVNNIIRNNAVGVYLADDVPFTLVKNNRFETNNAGAAGENVTPFAGIAGFGIGGYEPLGTAITENAFIGNMAAAVALQWAAYTQVTKNTSGNDGSLAFFVGGVGGYIAENQGKGFGAKGFLPLPLTTPSAHADAAIDIAGGAGLQINDNDLKEGKTPGYNGIAFTAIVTGYIAENSHVSNNTITGFAGNGIVAEADPIAEGTLLFSMISGNNVEDNGNDGILITEGVSNFYNSLVDNVVLGNHTNDCEDDTHLLPGAPFPGTAGTFNTWFNNIGILSDPAGLCSPPQGYPY